MDRELLEPLMLKALNSMQSSPQEEFCERFAALIAEECAKICEDLPEWANADDHETANANAGAIREKFGVKP